MCRFSKTHTVGRKYEGEFSFNGNEESYFKMQYLQIVMGSIDKAGFK